MIISIDSFFVINPWYLPEIIDLVASMKSKALEFPFLPLYGDKSKADTERNIRPQPTRKRILHTFLLFKKIPRITLAEAIIKIETIDII